MERLVGQLASFVGGPSSRLGSQLDISCVSLPRLIIVVESYTATTTEENKN